MAREYTDGTRVEIARSPAEEAQYEWRGWWPTNTPVPPEDLPEGLPGYLDLDELDARYVQRADIHVGPEEPSTKFRGKIWFRPATP